MENLRKAIKGLFIAIYDITIIAIIFASIIYLMGLIIMALMDYADLHPIRTAVGCCCLGVVLMTIDTIQDKRQTSRHKRKATKRGLN